MLRFCSSIIGTNLSTRALESLGFHFGQRFIAAAREMLVQTPGVTPHYVEVRDARHLLPVARVDREARLLIAATVEGVRLIDNGPLFPGVNWNG